MAKLTDDEKRLLQQLQQKAEAPDEPPMNKSVSFSIDLGDPDQIKRAVGFGLLPSLGDDKPEGESEEEDKEEGPRRRGYFGNAA